MTKIRPNKLTPEALAFNGLIDAEEYLRLSEEESDGHKEVSEENREKIREGNRRRWAKQGLS